MPTDNEDTDFQLQGFPHSVDESGLRSREPFEVLASQFVEELRAGLRPSFELYARRYPPHAERIRDCFPVLALLENARIDKEAASLHQNMPEKFPFTRLGDCELLCEMGRGGMGVVFQARDVQSGHVVAVKVLPWKISIVPEWRARFEKEARTAAQLRHRNIVPVFRYGTDQGYCFYVMQFVNGVGLDQVVERLRQTDGVVYQDEIQRIERHRPAGFVGSGSLKPQASVPDPDPSKRRRLTRNSWQAFARIMVQVTQALRCAHAAGTIHNDIKPGNVLLDHEGRVWVTDFGLSQPAEQKPTASPLYRIPSSTPLDRSEPSQGMAGTLRYMAPERLMGVSDFRSDLYSVGMTLFELAVQQPVFPITDTDQLIQAIMQKSPPAPSDLVRQFPGDLETIIMNCIAHSPADRYQSAESLLADLLKFGNGASVSSTRRATFSGFFQSVQKKLRRKNLDP